MRNACMVWAMLGMPTICLAQGPLFSSPGTPNFYSRSQVDRFTNTFNPAFGAVIDGFASFTDARSGADGYDAQLRLVELNAAAFVDPNAWAYIVLVAEEDALGVEEAAVEYVGLEGNSTVKAGRFFVDFGKQMQQHLEELRTLERPLVLREFLGEELSGTGIQFDHWFPLNDSTPLRFSIGVYASLLGEGHGHEDETPVPTQAVPDRKDIDELSIASRLTAMTDAGENGILQAGMSARFVPEYAFSFEGLEQADLSSTVVGMDATYSWTSPDTNRGFLIGGEALWFDGDLSAEVDDPVAPTLLTVNSGDVFGYFAYSDYRWTRRDNVGVQYSAIESPESFGAQESELDFYYTRHLTELRRLRFGVTAANSDLEGDSVRAYVQFTNFFGNHSHGLNW